MLEVIEIEITMYGILRIKYKDGMTEQFDMLHWMREARGEGQIKIPIKREDQAAK